MHTAPLSRTVLRDPALWIAAMIYVAVIGWLSAARYMGFNAGVLDLGTMYQAIASTLRGEPLMVTSARGNVSRLAGHVELIYYAFAPLIALWPDPRALLIGQTVLAASGAFPAYAIALRRLNSILAARCIAIIYLLYPTALTAALFDFHGDTLAMPLLLWFIDALDRRAWRTAVVWGGLSLLCKVYVAVAVAAIGAYLFLWGGQRRAGLATGMLAAAYGSIAFFIVRPFFEHAGGEHIPNNYVAHYFGALDTLLSTAGERMLVALVVIGPALLLAWRGWRWLAASAPILIAVLISTGPGTTYHYAYHHYALVVPFIVLAVVEGAERLRRATEGTREISAPRLPVDTPTSLVNASARSRPGWRSAVVFSTIVTALVSAVLVDIPINPTFWLGMPGIGVDQAAYGITPRDRIKQRFLSRYAPPRAPVAVSMFLGSHVADRATLYVLRYPDDPGGMRLPQILDRVDYAIADALFDWRTLVDGQLVGGIDYEAKEIAILLRHPNFGLIHQEDGLLLFARGIHPEEALLQEIAFVRQSPLPERRISERGPVQLLGAQIESLGDRRFRASFAWKLRDDPINQRLVAVSRLEGVEGARIVHLPSAVLQPTNTWLPEQIVLERFEIRLPDDVPPGQYRWVAAWYDPAHPEAYATDQRSRVGDELVIETIAAP